VIQASSLRTPDSTVDWRAWFKLALTIVAALRLGLGVILAATWGAVQPSLPFNDLGGASIYGELTMPTSPLGQLLLGVWVRWDAVQHLNLALRGYSDMGPGSTVFFPLYALLTRATAFVTGDIILAGLIVSTLAAVFALALIGLIGEHIFGTDAGRWATVALALYPTSVFLVAPYTESLFVALTLGALFLAYRGRWLTAAALAALAGLTRAPGPALAAAFAMVAWQQWAARPSRPATFSVPAALVAILAAGAGSVIFLTYRSLAGYPPILTVLKDYVGTSMVDPLTGLVLAFQQWILVRDLPTTLDIASAAIFIAVTALMLTSTRWRRPELIAYMLVSLGLLLGRHTVGAASLKSLSRYVLVLFPAFLVAGDWLAHRSSGIRFAYALVSGSLLVVLSSLYALWFFIG
jgi:hypothetical protein